MLTELQQGNNKKKNLNMYISTQGINSALLGGGCVCESLQSTLTSTPLGTLSEEELREKKDTHTHTYKQRKKTIAGLFHRDHHVDPHWWVWYI